MLSSTSSTFTTDEVKVEIMVQCKDTLHKMYAHPTGHIASLEIAGKFITSHIASAIKEASYCKELTQYITNQSGGRILKHLTLLIGRQDQGQANGSLQGRDLHTSSWSLVCLPQCLGVIRWNNPLTTGAPGAKSSRKHLHMSSNVPVQWICRKALMKAQATIWKKPSCKFVVTTLVSGISQWSTGAQVQWSGPIAGPADDIGTLAFKAFQEQQDIG